MCWHNWSKWEDKEKGIMYQRPTPFSEEYTRIKVGTYITQEKECKKCGKKKLQTIYSK